MFQKFLLQICFLALAHVAAEANSSFWGYRFTAVDSPKCDCELPRLLIACKSDTLNVYQDDGMRNPKRLTVSLTNTSKCPYKLTFPLIHQPQIFNNDSNTTYFVLTVSYYNTLSKAYEASPLDAFNVESSLIPVSSVVVKPDSNFQFDFPAFLMFNPTKGRIKLELLLVEVSEGTTYHLSRSNSLFLFVR
ncbi:MAG: hypothetical protein RL660_64 [Bacteroidota bacterium]|jgi:hypothetical protein